jgi:hypothetical protein
MKGILSQDMLCERLIMVLLYHKMDCLEAHKNQNELFLVFWIGYFRKILSD